MKKNKIDYSSLSRYIIARFVIALIFIYFSSIFIDWLIGDLIMPYLQDKFNLSEINFEGSSFVGLLKLIVGSLFGRAIYRLPGPIQGLITGRLFRGIDFSFLTPKTIASEGAINLAITYTGLIITILILLFIISATPYVLSGVWITHSVWKKMSELIAIDREQVKIEEQNRNLLLSDIAHDIKTPITAMSGYAKALNDGLVPMDKQGEYLGSIYAKSMRVSDLIDMMFEYIKLDSTGYTLNLEETDIAEAVRMVVAEFFQDFETAGIELELDIIEEEVLWKIDRIQFSRVIGNLLSNALKYLESGERVKLRFFTTTGRKGALEKSVEIWVEDSGAQIDDKLAETIFTPFSRGDETRSTKGGTGLGLSIAHKIIELHGGELILDRDLNDSYTKAFVIRL